MTNQNKMSIPFNWPHMTGKELYYIAEAHFNGKLAGDGPFTKKCHDWIQENAKTAKALLTHSCTAALEMSALLLDLQSGDEVIMPSYTFVSTANAFVLRGAVPVFIDIRADTLNIDETKIEASITERTRAIVVVHYAGVSCEMDTIISIAKKHNIIVIEDAAQGIMSSYKNRPLGSIGDLGAFSFHETKNVISGEGGALLINDKSLVERAEILREKGTDRSRFFRGLVDKYTWKDIGSSFLPGELIAAFLYAQLEEAENITAKRMLIWNSYHQAFSKAESAGLIRRPVIPIECKHNAHMYYLIVPSAQIRNSVLEKLMHQGVNAIFHYVPLHSAIAGQKFGRSDSDMSITNEVSSQIIRLPLWIGMNEIKIDYVVSSVFNALTK